jgi:hypothetical protein
MTHMGSSSAMAPPTCSSSTTRRHWSGVSQQHQQQQQQQQHCCRSNSISQYGLALWNCIATPVVLHDTSTNNVYPLPRVVHHHHTSAGQAVLPAGVHGHRLTHELLLLLLDCCCGTIRCPPLGSFCRPRPCALVMAATSTAASNPCDSTSQLLKDCCDLGSVMRTSVL